MNKYVLLPLLMLMCFHLSAQINLQDSTVQVITYWDIGEQYELSLQQLKYSEADTMSNSTFTYDAIVTVIDSTENSYTVEWLYKNFKSDAKDEFTQRIATLAEDVSVKVLMSETGVLLGIENWEEVGEYMNNVIDSAIVDFKDVPELMNVFQVLLKKYESKESIENSSIQDVQQYHNFHGGAYLLNEEYTGNMLTPNAYYPDKPFDTDVTIILEEIDEPNEQYTVRSTQVVNSEQLTETSFKYLEELSEQLGQDLPKREDFQNIFNIVETVSVIHNTGWVLESVFWKEVVVDGVTNMEIRRISMK